MNSGVKTKIISAFATMAIIASSFVFAVPAKAAVSANSLVSMTNSARVSAGLKPYLNNSVLTSSAYAKAQDMLKYDYFAHYAPSGKSPWSFIKNAGYSYIYAGENLAINFLDSLDVHDAWMNSPTHRSNILDKDFTEIGIAVVSGEYQGRLTTVVVQHFGRSTAQNIIPITKNAKNSVANNSSQEPINTQKPVDIQLNISVSQNPSLKISQKSPRDIIWYTSPVLYLIKSLS